MRRGKLVEIPAEWQDRTTHRQTIRKRPSKAPHKQRKLLKYGRSNESRWDKRERGS
jgi:hypothetical protein